MEDPTIAPQVPQKRPHEDDTEVPVTTPTRPPRSEASTPLSVLSVPTPPSMKVSQPDFAPSSSISAPPSSNAQQPAKRRKLTQQEKDDARLEKEAKTKAREEKKALKEAEDKLKAEQKAQKDEEKRLRDEEKQKKVEEREEKKRQKEEEEAKKQRSQMKLGAFFAKPKLTGVSPGKVSVESTQPLATAVSSSASSSNIFTPIANATPSSPQKNIVANAKSDYDRYFLPFSLPAHTILAPTNALMIDLAKVDAARLRLNNLIAQEDAATQHATLANFKSHLPRCDRGLSTRSVTEIVHSINSSSDQPIDLTGDKASTMDRPQDFLKNVSMKYIHFSEDVRPPYYGTHTPSYTSLEASHLARNPHSRTRKDTNYDYDSEAEWDEPEEGEDLDSEDDEDGAEDAEDDLDGFLDDEEDAQVKRRLISGDLQPISTGLCWQDNEGMSRLNDGSGAICTDFRDFAIGFLLDQRITTIDPFSTSYWTPEPSAIVPVVPGPANGASNHMNPPRAPLAQRTMNGLLNTINTPAKAAAVSATKTTKAKRMIPPEQLPAFKAEIDGKDLTKIGMVEALKKVFPKLPKDAITNTLSVVAARVGPTEKEKRWVLINA